MLVIALWCAIERIRSGIDLEDEATYIAIPYRFALGDRPFVDEINPIQTAAFVTRPLVEVYLYVTGGLDGIVLFMRIAYLCACIGTASIAATFVRKYLGLPLACLACAPIVVHMPGIPDLGYHTLASIGFTGGAFALALGASRENGNTWCFVGGVLHALAAVAIQVYAGAAFLALVSTLLWVAPQRKKSVLVPYAVGLGATALVFVPYFLDLGRATILYVLHHSNRDGTWLAKAEWVYWNQLRMIPHKAGFAIALSVLLVATRVRWRIPALLALLALPLLAYADREAVGANCNTTILVMTAPFLFVALRERGEAKPLMLGIWLPCFVSSLVLAWASSVHVLSEGYAQVPALVVTTILAVAIVRENAPILATWPATSWCILVLASFLVHMRRPYNEDAIEALDTRVTEGPWRGIATTREKAAYLLTMDSGIRAFEDPTKRVLFLNHFPAGYLMTRMRPAGDSVWAITCPGELEWSACADVLERDLARHRGEGVVVFDVRNSFKTRGRIVPLTPGPVQRVLDTCLEKVLVTPEYSVYFAP